ncbi:uncharacterized protein [Antedon mediterranea]|uniref:uncharacterized protein n=1 Tax=Antedon mediterranea TaxID=105859 RepID=UPI003AF46573
MLVIAVQYWLINIIFIVLFSFSHCSETNCQQYRTGTLGKYKYPMKQLAAEVTSFNFRVQVMKYAYIMLSPVARDSNSQYEIAIGNSEKVNTAAIRRCQDCKDRESVTTPYKLLDFNEFKQFWISFKYGKIEIGRYNETTFMSWTDQYPLDIQYIGIATGRLEGDFIFCDLKFETSSQVPVEGVFVLCIFILPVTALLIRSYLKKLKRKIKDSMSAGDDSDSFDNFYNTTGGIDNPSIQTPDPDPPSYDKCMEKNGERLRSVDEEGQSSSRDSESPPSYETAMANCLYDMNCDTESNKSVIGMWYRHSMNDNEDLETFV